VSEPNLKRGLFEFVAQAAADLEHQRNLRGVTLKRCEVCEGRGHMNDAHSDNDAHGSFWVSDTKCTSCRAQGRFEVPCAPEKEAAALRIEIAGLRERLRRAVKRCRK